MVLGNTLITGGSGMVGSSMVSVLPEAMYPSSSELNLLNSVNLHGVDNIIHLAARVGGIKANMDNMAEFYLDNSRINNNLLSAAAKSGVSKVVSLLSTCVYPDSSYVSYPLTEKQLHLGPPHSSNFGYAYSKRMVDVLSRAYREQYGCNFITAIPNNLYGKNDNFDLENGHVVPSIIRKIWEAKINNIDHIICWGDGSPLREFTYSEDVAKILVYLLENYNGQDPINIGNTKEHSIEDVVKILCLFLEYDGEIVWDSSKPKGQHRKPSSNQKLLDLGWKAENYTSLEDGLKKTCEWFKIRYPNVRGVQ